ncbi:MAG: hypothetical protein K0B15_07305 [Lentimicrobium sp.]|nr:hypothetical protein [Lentimicrobium sp.]
MAKKKNNHTLFPDETEKPNCPVICPQCGMPLEVDLEICWMCCEKITAPEKNIANNCPTNE